MTDPVSIDGIRALFPGIAAGAVERERNRVLPHLEIRDLAHAGLGAVRLPREEGGAGLSWEETTGLLIDLAAADSSIVQALRGHFTLVDDALETFALRRHRTPAAVAQAEHVLRFAAERRLAGNAWTEPGAGGTATTATPAERDGVAGYLLSGTKYYTTGSIFADWADVTARHAETGEALDVVAPLTPAAGAPEGSVAISDDWSGFGQRQTGSGTARFDDVFVPAGQVKPFAERIGYQTGLYQQFLLTVHAGIAQGVVDDLGVAVRNRTRNYSHANTELVRDDPQILQVAGELEAAAFTARTLALRTARLLDTAIDVERAGWSDRPEKAAAPAHILAFETATAKAQVALSGIVPQAATKLFDALSASATETGLSLDRHWRNARTVANHNPWIFKARQLGDLLVNGNQPLLVWDVGVNKGAGHA
ncbi:acyl-CoA dehydrogenase family protein [Rothia halotolerans]|uniref:acyl-CoA dehydrogenase family protein n=1 Tax=Rothia halotolerans TaxID=405770 RepID=UPI00101DAE9D|nr:acyl-CoA dehydrogenase family protein [Rothia halotolerans]